MRGTKERALVEYKRRGQKGAYKLAKANCKLYDESTPQFKYWDEVRQWLYEPKQSSKGLVAGWYSQIKSDDT